jgi:hypothetical protein
MYGSDQYWWILMKYNQVFDVFNDLYEGQVLSVPDRMDVDDASVHEEKPVDEKFKDDRHFDAKKRKRQDKEMTEQEHDNADKLTKKNKL